MLLLSGEESGLQQYTSRVYNVLLLTLASKKEYSLKDPGLGNTSLRAPWLEEDDRCLRCQKNWTPFPSGHRGTALDPLPCCR